MFQSTILLIPCYNLTTPCPTHFDIIRKKKKTPKRDFIIFTQQHSPPPTDASAAASMATRRIRAYPTQVRQPNQRTHAS